MYQEVIKDYRKQHQKYLEEELDDFSASVDFSKVVYQVAYCKGEDGKKYPHQYRITKKACNDTYNILKKLSFKNVKDFDFLYSCLETHLLPIHGIGPLYVYDSALRLGKYLGLEPTKVYLHAGTLEGAKRLNLNTSKGFLNTSELPLELQIISPKYVEAILCIYKKHFKNGEVIPSSTKSSCSINCARSIPNPSSC